MWRFLEDSILILSTWPVKQQFAQKGPKSQDTDFVALGHAICSAEYPELPSVSWHKHHGIYLLHIRRPQFCFGGWFAFFGACHWAACRKDRYIFFGCFAVPRMCGRKTFWANSLRYWRWIRHSALQRRWYSIWRDAGHLSQTQPLGHILVQSSWVCSCLIFIYYIFILFLELFFKTQV